jgi:hypothetical protein
MNSGPLEFRPMHGLLKIGEQLARRFGLFEMWDGEEGLGAVAREKLKEIGVPDKPVPLSGQKAVTPLQMADRVGFIKKRKRIRA